jgi:CheY-like chemotaxis protein
MGELLGDMAHEINNLLMGVFGFAELELHRARDGESAQNLQSILACAQDARTLTKNLLRFARPPDAGAYGLVEEAVKSVLDLFRYRMRDVSVSWEQEGELPAVSLPTGDLRLVLANLIKNALEALEGSEPASIRIRAERKGEQVSVSVWNSGPGIPPHALTHLFTPFFTTKGGQKGTGLGLTIARRLLALAGGNLRAENEPAGGVTFTLEVPSSPADSASVVQAGGAPVRTLAALPSRLKGRHVLVVDDENSAREVFRLMVSELGGAEVDACASGEEALRLIEQIRFDAVVLDLRMPGISGQEVYRRLPRSLQKRVVFVTGDTLGSAVRTFLTSTRQPTLFKPLDWADLLKAVDAVLEAA